MSVSLSKLSFDTSLQNSFYSNSLSETFFELNLGLSMRSVNYTSRVLVYDDFLGNIVGYLSNIIIILYFFNSIYNSFGAKVYFTEKFFMKNPLVQGKIVDELKKKLERTNISGGSGDSSSSLNPPQEINQIDENQNFEPDFNKVNKDGFVPYVGEHSEKYEKFDSPEKNQKNENLAMVDIKIRENNPNDPRKINLINESSNQNEHTSPHSLLVNKRNNYKYNFFEHVFNEYFCCVKSKKKQETQYKSQLLENSESFLDYYLDVNTYVKKMIELDMLKLYLIKDKEDFEVINNFAPVIKNNYSENYENKIHSLYKNRLSNSETEELLENIKYMKSDDARVYKSLLNYCQ
jgi:hypothetical protein